MPANPYVTVPGGTASQQALWVQAYYRNLGLQNQYDQQPNWADALGHGLGQGIGAGAGQYLGVLDQNAKFQQANNLQAQQDSAAADRQRAAIQQANDLQAQRESAQAEAEQRKAIIAQVLAQQQQRNLGLARQQFYGGMGPVSVAQPDKWMPPADYNDTSQAYPQPPTYMTPPVQDVLSGMDPSLAGLITHEDIKQAGAQPKGGWDDGATSRARLAYDAAANDPALAKRLMATTPLGEMDVHGKPLDVKEPKSQLATMSTQGALQAIINAPDGSPVFNDPMALQLGRTPDEIRAAARRTLYGNEPAPSGGMLGYETTVAAGRAFAGGLNNELGKQAAPMGTEAQNWINPKTLEAAPQGWSERDARANNYVAVDPKQRELVDNLRQVGPLANELRTLFDPSVIGQFQGRFNTMLEYINAAPEKFAPLRAATLKYLAAVGRVEAGAALTATEKGIYFANHPQITMGPQEYLAALATTETGMRIARSRVLGGRVPEPGSSEVPLGQDMQLDGRRVVVDKVNTDGSLVVHDPITGQSNIWRP